MRRATPGATAIAERSATRWPRPAPAYLFTSPCPSLHAAKLRTEIATRHYSRQLSESSDTQDYSRQLSVSPRRYSSQDRTQNSRHYPDDRYRQVYRKRTLARWSRARLLWIPRFETEAPNIDQAILVGTHGMALAPKRCPDTDHVCGLNTRKPINLIEATELRPR